MGPTKATRPKWPSMGPCPAEIGEAPAPPKSAGSARGVVPLLRSKAPRIWPRDPGKPGRALARLGRTRAKMCRVRTRPASCKQWLEHRSMSGKSVRGPEKLGPDSEELTAISSTRGTILSEYRAGL